MRALTHHVDGGEAQGVVEIEGQVGGRQVRRRRPRVVDGGKGEVADLDLAQFAAQQHGAEVSVAPQQLVPALLQLVVLVRRNALPAPYSR